MNVVNNYNFVNKSPKMHKFINNYEFCSLFKKLVCTALGLVKGVITTAEEIFLNYLKSYLVISEGVIPRQFNQFFVSRNPPSGISTKLGLYIAPTLVINYAKNVFSRPHNFVCWKHLNFKNFSLLTIFKPFFYIGVSHSKKLFLSI